MARSPTSELILGIASLCCAGSAAVAQMLVVGGQPLFRTAQATREVLLFVDVYRVTLALPRGVDSLAEAQRHDTAKAFRVDVLYGGATADRLPGEWRDELLAALPSEDVAALRQAYAGLMEGEQITVAYAPAEGTTLSIGDVSILHDPGHELIAAFFDLWLGDHPVSEDIKQSLLTGESSL